jgi:diacylglycerol kinase family enzyme
VSRNAHAPPVGARVVAAVAFAGYAALVLEMLLVVRDEPWLVLAAFVSIATGVPVAWTIVTRPRSRARFATVAVGIVALGLAFLAASGQSASDLAIVTATIAATGAAGVAALQWEVRAAAAQRWSRAMPARRGVLLLNLRSGGGKAEKFDLVGACHRRGIEPIVLGPGDDLRQLAEHAVARGADVIGMAGGDGSQGLVAAVAADHDVGFVCVPSGTRNHFALDLGVDRDDVVGALDAFGDALEARIDLAEVNGRVFVNNVSLGVYARIVASQEYRDAKLQTAANMLPSLIGPDAAPSGLHVRMPGNDPVDDPQIVIVSNDPYRLDRLAGFGTRARLDLGVLGAAALRLRSASDATKLIAAEAAGQLDRFQGWQSWKRADLEVGSDATVAAGIDGEAVELTPPLRFVSRPGALTVRIAPHHPGVSPAALQSGWARSTFLGLGRIVSGRPSGLVDGATAR